MSQRANATCSPSDPHYCDGTNSTGDPQHHQYVCGDYRLGPLTLPTKLPLSNLLYSYDRFDGLCPGAFLAKWTNSNGTYNYPPMDGFVEDAVTGQAIRGYVKLKKGAKLDRFGGETGAYLSPKGAPFVERALPPQSLDTSPSAPEYPNGYHVYEVLKEFVVVVGPIAEWFGQPGGGSQYELVNTTVAGLLNDTAPGPFLRRLNVSEY